MMVKKDNNPKALEEQKKENSEPQEKKQENNEPWWKRIFQEKRIVARGRVAVIVLEEKSIAKPLEIETRNGMFSVKGKTYHVLKDCIWRLNVGKGQSIPLALIHEGSFTPISGDKELENSNLYAKLQEKFSVFQDLSIKAIRQAELVKTGAQDMYSGKSVSIKQVILYCILAAVVGAVVVGGF